MQDQPANFTVVNPSNKKLCFVGRSSISVSVLSMVSQHHDCENVTVEDLYQQTDGWLAERSFIVITSDVPFKMKIVQYLDDKNVSYFSIIHNQNVINFDVYIGEGCYVGPYNSITVGLVKIGRHCVIGSFNVISHNAVIGDFCHVSHHTFFAECIVGAGVVIGTNVVVADYVKIADYCNFITGSVVTKNTEVAATYYGNRQIDKNGSLLKRIL